MTDTVKNKNGNREFLISTLLDPVLLYTVLVMMSIMYHYRDSLTAVYGIAAYVVGWLVFRIYDFVNKHHIIGFVICIVLYILFGRAAGYAMDMGEENYPITWGLWFLTPQDSLRYNKWYTLAIFILFLIFMLSVIYYFTRVRYRILMNFLIFIIPFAIYGKEYEKMPIGFIIGLAVGYVLMMVVFRQLQESDKVKVVDKPEIWRTIGVFTVLFALCSALVPKPEIEADRTVLEMLINADAFTDRLVRMLDVFRDTASGDQFRNQLNDQPIFYAEADKPMRLKTATFSYYDFSKDSWGVSDLDSYYSEWDSAPVEMYPNGGVAEAVFYAAGIDSSFSETYGLGEYAEKMPALPDKRVAKLYSAGRNINIVPVPQGASALTDSTYRGGGFQLTRSAALYLEERDSIAFTNYVFELNPYPDEIGGDYADILNKFGHMDDYGSMLGDALDVLENDDSDDETVQRYRKVINNNVLYYDTYTEDLLDYGGNDRIYQLAAEITEGLDSEYEKAKAIEWYFVTNDFVYDLEYQKATGENVDDFLFRTKTGVCWEYASAMTLLARAAGIPARFCEGYLMQNEYSSPANGGSDRKFEGYSVSARDAHAFPELYIKGHGWVAFEPTMTNVSQNGQNDKQTTTSLLSRAGLILLAAAAVLLLFILIRPVLTHKLFLLVNGRRSPDMAVSGVMRRLCRLYGISRTNTATEAAQLVREVSGADVSRTAELFSSSVYGGVAMRDEDKNKAMEEYNTAYEALRESRKQKCKKVK